MKSVNFFALTWFAALMFALVCGGCAGGTTAGNPLIDDSSASGVAAGAVGGALSGSSSGGTQANLLPKMATQLAGGACPTFKTDAASGCSVSSGTMWLSYDACSFHGSSVVWNGIQAILNSAGTASCGSLPDPGQNGSLIRQFVSASGSNTPGSATATNASGNIATIDDLTADLKNFNGDPITTIANGGYGDRVDFTAGAKSGVTLARHLTAVTSFDHSISGQVTVSEAPGASSRTITGSVQVYHNLMRVIGTSTFNSVTHSDDCCLPIAGSIKTTFAAGSHVSPTRDGGKLVGLSETLTFTGCGTGSLAATDGTTTDVRLGYCF